MEYKYVIHLSEDLAQHEETIRELLAFNDNFKGSTEEYRLLCESWFSFKRFLHPGKAIEYYESQHIFPDLKIQDIDFTEIKDKKVPEQFRKNISGIFELEYLLKAIEKQKANKTGKECLFIPYSGKLGDELIVEALNKTGWENRIVNKIIRIADSRLVKDEQAQLKLRIRNSLKELARLYLEKLDGGERSRLKETAQGKSHAVWKNYVVKFEDFDFSIRNMLVGFGDTQKMSPLEVCHIVDGLLSESQSKIEFNGEMWKEDKECRNGLNEYLEDVSKYQITKRLINIRALDVLLDFIRIHDEFGFNSTIPLSLFKRNKLYKIGTHSRKNNWKKIFTDKLVARRVMIALSELYQSTTSDELVNICELVLNGETEVIISRSTKGGAQSTGETREQRSVVRNTITRHLGLFSDNNLIVVDDGQVLREEMSFVQAYVSDGIILGLRGFLDSFSTRLSNLATYGINVPDYFLDLTAFNELVFSVQSKAPNQMKLFLKNTDDFLKSDAKYKHVRKILALSNPLFL